MREDFFWVELDEMSQFQSDETKVVVSNVSLHHW